MFAIPIRPATDADAEAISALIRRTVQVSNAADYDAATIAAICKNFTPALVLEKMATRDVFVAHTPDGDLCGTISLGNGKLHSLFVDPDRQRNGIGRRLVAYLEQHARRSGLRELQLSSSLTARPFYAQLGYQDIHFEPRADGSTWLMMKALADETSRAI
jgi:N-acetylglutamate synthase-like GNAT family acetyltransferase